MTAPHPGHSVSQVPWENWREQLGAARALKKNPTPLQSREKGANGEENVKKAGSESAVLSSYWLVDCGGGRRL